MNMNNNNNNASSSSSAAAGAEETIVSNGSYTSKSIPNNFGSCEYTQAERNYLQSMLSQKLHKDDLASRPGPGGGRVTYIEAWKVIEIANKIIGFNGWSSQIIDISTDYLEHNTQTGRFSCGCSAIVRVTLKDGCFHEDCGCGSSENQPKKYMAIEASKKKAISDALKRALKNFGNALGLTIYDHEHVKKVKANEAKQPKKPNSGAIIENDTVTSMGDNPFFKTEATQPFPNQTSPLVVKTEPIPSNTSPQNNLPSNASPQNNLNDSNSSNSSTLTTTTSTSGGFVAPTGFLNTNHVSNTSNSNSSSSGNQQQKQNSGTSFGKPMFGPKNPSFAAPKHNLFGQPANKPNPASSFGNNPQNPNPASSFGNNPQNPTVEPANTTIPAVNQSSPNSNVNTTPAVNQSSPNNNTNSPPLLASSNISPIPSQNLFSQQGTAQKRTFFGGNGPAANSMNGFPNKKPRIETPTATTSNEKL